MKSFRPLLHGHRSARSLARVTIGLAALATFLGPPAGSQEGAVPPSPVLPTDSAAVAATVVGYHRALVAADSSAALALLTEDAVVLESGGMETREEYRSHHLPSDMQFARAVQAREGPLRVTVRGDVAWAASTSVAQGTFRGRPVNSVGAELMVLTRGPGGWRIAAIHWSSRARRP